MKQLLVSELEKIKPCYLQGTVSGEVYPRTFFTFWNFDTPEDYADNKPVRCVWSYWVYCYSDDPDALDTALNSAIDNLRAAGFIVQGRGEDIASDRPTHTGRMITVYYIENY